MISFLLIYKWAWIAAVFGGSALSLIGLQMASRAQAVQALTVSQAASLGVVFGLALTHAHGSETETALAFWPSVFGFIFATAIYLICELAIPQRLTSRNTYFVGMFAVLLSLSYLTISLAPNLESHMASAFFGDISVASDVEGMIVAGFGALSLVFLLSNWRRILSWSFDLMIFKTFLRTTGPRRTQIAFVLISIGVITTSMQFLGLLFTLSCLFLPAMFLARPLAIIAATSIGVTAGLFISLWHGKLPTSPTLTVGLLVSSLVLALVRRFFRFINPSV